MKEQHRPVQIIIWLQTALLVVGLVGVILGIRRGVDWALPVGSLSFAILLLAPACLLVFRPHLGVMWVDTFLNILAWRPPRKRMIAGGQTTHWRKSYRWDDLSDADRAAVLIASLFGLILGIVVLVYTFNQMGNG